MALEYPVAIASQECEDRLLLHHSAKNSRHDWPTIHIAIKEIGRRFTIAVANEATAQLIRRMWEREIVPEGNKTSELIIGCQASFSGRLIDSTSRVQWLSYAYAPLTVVKRALRWTYACQCAGTQWMPLHGAIIKIDGVVCCITGCRAAGKTYLTDELLQSSKNSQMLVDDWSIAHAATGTIVPTGDTYLHVRGSSLHRGSCQLAGGSPQLVELCDNDLKAEETRYLIRKNTLHHFLPYGQAQLDVLILVAEPLAKTFSTTTDRSIVDSELAAEIGHFWDDSNVSLPADTVSDMARSWRMLLDRTRHVVLRGHRSVPVSQVAEALMRHI